MKLTDLRWWRKRKSTISEQAAPILSPEELPLTESVKLEPTKPTLEETLELALREKQYATASTIYLQLGQTDQAVQMYLKANATELLWEIRNDCYYSSSLIFPSAVAMFSERGINIKEAISKVFAYSNQFDYSLRPLTHYLKNLKQHSTVNPAETAALLSEMVTLVDEKMVMATLVDKRLKMNQSQWEEKLAYFFEICNDQEKAKEAYLQAALLLSSDQDTYERPITLRKKAGLSGAEAVSLTLHERLDKVYLISKIVRDYADAITLEDREAIIKNMPDFESAGVYQAEIAGIYERLGFLREAAGLYAQANGEESLAKSLQIYSQLDDEVSIIGLIATRINSGYEEHLRWAVNETSYDQDKKDLLTTQLQLLQHLSGGKLPAKEETLLFMGY